MLLEVFLKNFNQGQYGLIHNLSNSHIIQPMVNFAVVSSKFWSKGNTNNTIWAMLSIKFLNEVSSKAHNSFISNVLKKLNQSQYNLTHIVLNMIFNFFSFIFLISIAFSNLPNKFWSKDNVVWPMLSLDSIKKILFQTFIK